MGESVYTATATIRKVEGVHRRAELAVGPAVDMGVHGAVKEMFGLEDAPDLPLPVDFIVAATGTWMLGTLNGALEVRQVSLPPDDIVAEVEGINELVEGIPTLTRIRIRYRLRIPSGSDEVVERALARHQDRCPTAQSLAGAVEIEWTAEVEEAGGDPDATADAEGGSG